MSLQMSSQTSPKTLKCHVDKEFQLTEDKCLKVTSIRDKMKPRCKKYSIIGSNLLKHREKGFLL